MIFFALCAALCLGFALKSFLFGAGAFFAVVAVQYAIVAALNEPVAEARETGDRARAHKGD